jgi:hypothetical protein
MNGDSKPPDLGGVMDATTKVGNALAALEFHITTPLQNELEANSSATNALAAYLSASGTGVKGINLEMDLRISAIWNALNALFEELRRVRERLEADKLHALQKENEKLRTEYKTLVNRLGAPGGHMSGSKHQPKSGRERRTNGHASA